MSSKKPPLKKKKVVKLKTPLRVGDLVYSADRGGGTLGMIVSIGTNRILYTVEWFEKKTIDPLFPHIYADWAIKALKESYDEYRKSILYPDR
jgi:hypothetical protein